MKKIKIVHCMSALSGGVGKMIMNYFDHIDSEKYEVHIITQDIVSQSYLKLYKDRNYVVHKVPSKKEGILKNYISLERIMKKEKFDIAHCHMTTTNLFPLMAAKNTGIKVRISHSHLAGNWNCLEKIIIRLSKIYATDFLACGEDAGRSLFGSSPFIIIQNAIDLRKYQFSEDIRKQQRRMLGLEYKTVFCHVGRFTNQKNHEFLLQVFKIINQKRKDAVLMLIGEGELFDDIKSKAKEMNLSEQILFLGMRNDVAEKLQAADAFILPSKIEGLCIAAIEAQASGLPCVFSPNIDPKTKINENVKIMSNMDAEAWANTCLEITKLQRVKSTERIRKAGFDILEEAKKLDQFYVNAIKEEYKTVS